MLVVFLVAFAQQLKRKIINEKNNINLKLLQLLQNDQLEFT